jgi:hypothetical protein
VTSADDEWRALWGEWGLDAEGEPLPLLLRTKTGQGSQGPIYEPERSLPGLVQTHKPRMVRNSDGDEVTSTTRVLAPLSLAGAFTLGSLVKPAHEDWTPVAAVTVTDDPVLPAVAVDLG